MRFLASVLIAVALGGIFWGVFDLIFLCHGTAEPQAVTLEELGRFDGTTNVHLVISDFQIGSGCFQETGKDGDPRRVWIPLLTSEGRWTPRPVVAWVEGKLDETKLDYLASRPVLKGIVTNSVQWVGADQRSKLSETYPGQDFTHALAFNIDRTFPTTTKVAVLLSVGTLALIVSAIILIREMRGQTPT